MGGVKGKPRREDEELRREVLKRDKRKCQMCKCAKKSQLQIHHIKRWADAVFLRFDPNNCITLCKVCHQSIRNKEHHYESYFYEIIQGNKKSGNKKSE